MARAPIRMAASTISGTNSGPAEDVHNIHRPGDAAKIAEGLLAEHLILVRIYGDDSVSGTLHVFRDTIARPVAFTGQADHGDSVGGAERSGKTFGMGF